MHVLIVEDEIHNSKLLQGMISGLRPNWEIQATLESVKETVSWLKNHKEPDLIFMDIQLNDGICFSIFDQVKVESMVVFTTAYDEYAIQSFQVNSIDYLLKPVKEARLKEAIEKFEHLFKQMKQPALPDYQKLIDLMNYPGKYRKRIMVSDGKSMVKIDVEQVACFITENHNTFAIKFNNEGYLLDATLEKLESELDPDMFFRSSRSSVININAVLKVENNLGGKLKVTLPSPLKRTVKISRLKAAAFKDWVDK
ncbi:LytR/AlgR family response regulator transcription factor [Salinivirga cyanobacteriivorans]